MKFLLFSLIFCLPAFSSDVYSIKIPREVVEAMDLSDDLARRLSGGDIIGNGGGIAEQDFRYAFRRVPGIVESCLESPFCMVPNKEVQLLKNIKKLATLNASNKDRLIFLSEEEYPGFFRDSNDSNIRIAKTANIPGAPIFINLDMLYSGKQALLSFPAIISVIVHELGHQAKIKSHSLLDELGTRIREFLLEDSASITQKVVNHKLKVSYYNLKEANRFSEAMFHFKDKMYSFKSLLIEAATCEKDSVAIGFKLSNLHWNRRVDVSRGVFTIPFKAWLKVFCMDIGTSAIWVDEKDIKVELLFISRQGDPDLHHYSLLVDSKRLEDPVLPLRH